MMIDCPTNCPQSLLKVDRDTQILVQGRSLDQANLNMVVADATIIGAGPYGLSAAAHLRTVKGLEVRVFGDPMSFWSRNMPVGMFLRSNWTATQISDPGRALTLEAFQSESGSSFSLPPIRIPLALIFSIRPLFQGKLLPTAGRNRKVVEKPYRVCCLRSLAGLFAGFCINGIIRTFSRSYVNFE